ncbi:serine protease inhibitor 1-like [Ctenocephalides felis]|uniref:serine protease inhibitor 1-like n=1 Tax=Ctenocephalides felis TaxID=7515 RepID=UPI000E6E375F|nr:serine protease inhibitor 1-like [Ctenocephalides felis]
MRCLTVVVLVALVAVAFAADCGENERFACKLGCDKRCDNLNNICIDIGNNCKCFCKRNYARNENNECIPEDQCGAEATTTSASAAETTAASAAETTAAPAQGGETTANGNTVPVEQAETTPPAGFPDGIFTDSS